MLPELDFKKRFAMDKAFYFDKKLKDFLIFNKNTKETLSKYNVQTIMALRETKKTVGLTRAKFGILFHIAICMNDYEMIGNVRTIHNSLKEQSKLIGSLDKTLLRTRIDEKWADAIKLYECDKVIERCNRLEKTIFPDLIKISKLSIYEHYLKSKGTTLDDDILRHIEDGDDGTYYDHIMSVIEQHEKVMPQEELERIKSARNQYINIKNKRNDTIKKEKQERKTESKKEFAEDAGVILQNWASDSVRIEQAADGTRIKMVYKKALSILESLNDKLTGDDISFKLIAIARYNSREKISTSNFRWLNVTNGEYKLSGGFGSATPFFDSIQPEEFDKAMQYCKEKGYVIATVDCNITGKKTEDIIYDYYRELPEQTWSDSKYFGYLKEEERKSYVQRIFHRSMSTIKCVTIICEAYGAFGEPTDPINTKIDKKKLASDLHEIYDFYGCWENDALLNDKSKNEDCKYIRSRINSVAANVKSRLVNAIDFGLTDKDERWVDAIKNIINFNSYTNEELRCVYDMVEKYKASNPIPESFFIDGEENRIYKHVHHYEKSGNDYTRKELLYANGELVCTHAHDHISKLRYVEAYLSANDPVL